ncbi:hypothetical protein [Pseudactinotalea sp. HY158]|nr:hypothetical protein [Pseudactinotalea sp. HY158]
MAHQVPTVVIGVDGWQDYRSDPSLFDGPDAEIDDLFYGAPAS